MAETLQGKLILIGETQSVGANGFLKREAVIETPDDKYPQKLKVEFTKDKCDLLDSYKVGDNVTVEYNLRGSEYNGKYYVSLQAWKIAGGSGGGSPAPRQAAARPAARPAQGQRPQAGRPQQRQNPPPPQDSGAGLDEDAPW